MATDKIVAEYTVKVDAALKNLDKLANKVNKIDDERKKTQAGFKDMSSSLASSFSKVGAAIGLAFSTQQLVSFGKEAIELAAKAEGISRAFSRLNNPNLLADLRKATKGTVSDLELMQRAVQAKNFKIPLDQMATLLEFATKRATETGQSVDYLVDSIITGLGRKSPLILDNLQLTTKELQEELGDTALSAASIGELTEAAAKVAKRAIEEMGDQADTTAEKIAQIGVAFENLKTSIGTELISEIDKLNTELEKTGQLFGVDDVNLFSIAMGALENAIRNFTLPIELANEKLQEFGAAFQFLKEILGITEGAVEEYIKSVEKASVATTSVADAIGAFYKRLRENQQVIPQEVITIELLNKQLSDLKKELANAEVGSTTFFRILDRVTTKTKELNEAIALTKLDDALKVDTEESIEAFGQVIGATDSLNATVTDIFGGAGSAMVEAYWDTFLQNSLDALETTEERTKRLMELEELRRQDNRDFFDTTLMAWQSLTNTVATLVEAQYQRQYNALDQSLKKEQITREQYDKRKAQLGREQAKKQKEFAIVQAVINTALGVTNAFATAPNIILGAVLAAVVAAAGAAEIATISSQPLPQFAEGGWVDGKGLIHGRSHKQGGVKIEAEGNEYITKGKYAKPNAEILEAINTGNWEKYKMENIITPAIEQVLSGGMENIGASYMLQNQFNDRNILRGLDRNRMSEKNGFIYLGDRIERALLSKGNDRYA